MNMEVRRSSLGILLFFAAGASFAQPPAARPAYEAATIKVNVSGDRGTSSNGSRGQVLMSNQSLKRMVERAYDARSFEVAGPAWIEDVRFDVSAKYPPDSKIEDRPLMLRTLLEDRLKLAVHRESKEMPGFALLVAKGGFKLKPAEPGANETHSNGDGHVQTIAAKKTSMAALATLLSRSLNEPVLDQTGLAGVYDFDLRWTIEETQRGQESFALLGRPEAYPTAGANVASPIPAAPSGTRQPGFNFTDVPKRPITEIPAETYGIHRANTVQLQG
jgi:uncharacterized protein (TIGR03435 family)